MYCESNQTLLRRPQQDSVENLLSGMSKYEVEKYGQKACKTTTQLVHEPALVAEIDMDGG